MRPQNKAYHFHAQDAGIPRDGYVQLLDLLQQDILRLGKDHRRSRKTRTSLQVCMLRCLYQLTDAISTVEGKPRGNPRCLCEHASDSNSAYSRSTPIPHEKFASNGQRTALSQHGGSDSNFRYHPTLRRTGCVANEIGFIMSG